MADGRKVRQINCFQCCKKYTNEKGSMEMLNMHLCKEDFLLLESGNSD